MFAELTQWILDTIRTHGVWGVILGVALEEIIVPIPSPVVIMAAGAILIDPYITFQAALPTLIFVITIPAVITSLLGSYIPFAVGYYGGRPLIERTERFLGVSWDDIGQIKARLQRNNRETITLALFRAIPIMPLSLVSGAAGIIRMDWKRYSVATLLGMVPRVIMLALLGWKLGELYLGIALRFESLESIVTFTIVGLVVLGVVAHRFNLIDRIKKLVL